MTNKLFGPKRLEAMKAHLDVEDTNDLPSIVVTFLSGHSVEICSVEMTTDGLVEGVLFDEAKDRFSGGTVTFDPDRVESVKFCNHDAIGRTLEGDDPDGDGGIDGGGPDGDGGLPVPTDNVVQLRAA